ncbi:MAG: hypothetical protein Tsb002_10970 [Wenzhouxiangellaceae bacterium]
MACINGLTINPFEYSDQFLTHHAIQSGSPSSRMHRDTDPPAQIVTTEITEIKRAPRSA